MGENLKPCPFCGGEVRLVCTTEEDGRLQCINYEDELEADYSFIHCYNCDMDFMPHTTIAREVMEAWNTRKPMDKIVEQLEEAKNKRFIYNEVGNVCGSTYEANIEIDKAIKIVKKGGV